MNKRFFVFVLLGFFSGAAFGQLGSITARKQGRLYLGGGYCRAWFSKSDISIKGIYPDAGSVPDDARGQKYEMTLLSAKAADAPDIPDFSQWGISSPQYNLRLGYLFYGEYVNGVELSFDHFTYTVKPDQTLRVQGILYDSTSGGVVKVERDMLVSDELVHFEHNGGCNYLMLSFVRGMPLARNRTETHTLYCLVKPGIGVVVPQSLVVFNGVRYEEPFHIAGYVAGLEAAFRYTAVDQIYIETSGKVGYANFTDVLTAKNISASHAVSSFSWMVSIGYLFRL